LNPGNRRRSSLGMARSHPRPGSLSARAPHLGLGAGRRRPGHRLARSRTGRWPPLRFPAPGRRLAGGGLGQPARRPRARPARARGPPVAAGLGIPGAPQGPLALPPPCRAHRRHPRNTRGVWAAQAARPLERLLVTPRTLPGRSVVAPGGRGARAPSVERDGEPDADRTPAGPCAGPHALASETAGAPALPSARWPGRGRRPAAPVAPTWGGAAPTARASALGGPAPRGAVTLPPPVHGTAGATAAPACAARLPRGQASAAAAREGPGRPPGPGHASGGHRSFCRCVPRALAL
jgi:hypothetical protein